jgi:hypothetical protein
MKNQLFLFCILSLLLISCDDEVPQGPNFTDPNPNDTEIQVENKSNFALDSFYLNTSGGSQLFGRVDQRKTTNLKSFLFSYPEMEIRFQINGKNFLHIPVDYSNMTKVESGKYELEINSIDTNKLSFTFLLEELE